MSSKRGRKRNDNLPPNRARDVQRAFRARRAAHLQAMEERVAELEEENDRLRAALNLPPANRPALGKGPTGKDKPKAPIPASSDSGSSMRQQSMSPTITGLAGPSSDPGGGGAWDQSVLMKPDGMDGGAGPSGSASYAHPPHPHAHPHPHPHSHPAHASPISPSFHNPSPASPTFQHPHHAASGSPAPYPRPPSSATYPVTPVNVTIPTKASSYTYSAAHHPSHPAGQSIPGPSSLFMPSPASYSHTADRPLAAAAAAAAGYGGGAFVLRDMRDESGAGGVLQSPHQAHPTQYSYAPSPVTEDRPHGVPALMQQPRRTSAASMTGDPHAQYRTPSSLGTQFPHLPHPQAAARPASPPRQPDT